MEISKEDRERLDRGMDPVPHALIDRDCAIRIFLDQLVGSGHPRRSEWVAAIDEMIERLRTAEEPGDELWHIKSRYIGPLAGHEGLGIVREGKIIRYERIRQY